MRRYVLKFGIFLLVACFAGTLVVTYSRVKSERETLLDDLNRRARVIAKSLAPASIRLLKKPPTEDEEDLAERLSGQGRTMGILLCDPAGKIIARSIALSEIKDCDERAIGESAAQGEEKILFEEEVGPPLHSLVHPLRDRVGKFVGTLTVVHEASYISERVRSLVTWTTLTVAILALLISSMTYFFSRRSFQKSIDKLLGWMKSEKEPSSLPPPTESLLKPVAREVEKMSARLRSARDTAREVSKEKQVTNLWTAARLKAHAVTLLENRKLIVVSNREPYMHAREHGRTKVLIPAGGLVTALDPILRATSGLWIAHGAGDGDWDVTDPEGKVLVPPDAPSYTLKRIPLSRDEEEGYYYGFSNEAMWPLCHLTHHRPLFEEKDWATYKQVNQKFADEIVKECGEERPFILVQDYHFTLLPRFIKERRPDAVVGLFWHIPWPNLEAFQVCPWKREILEGMLGSDFVGFHLQSYCNNFLDTVNSLFPVRVDWDRFAVLHEKGSTVVKPFPISIQPWNERKTLSDEEFHKLEGQYRQDLELKDARIVVSVDRLDYTKGIPERLGAIDRFLEKYPSFKEKVSFVQLAAPSRIHIPRYRELVKEIEETTDQINWKHRSHGWKPIILLKEHHDPKTVYTFLRMADVCIVSSLADGMNLVAKEFVAAREAGDGVLILSEFTGVARDFQEALQINPHARADFAEAIRIALEMPAEEQKRRMAQLKARVAENNVYKWAADLLSELAQASQAIPQKEGAIGASSAVSG